MKVGLPGAQLSFDPRLGPGPFNYSTVCEGHAMDGNDGSCARLVISLVLSLAILSIIKLKPV